jgi:uncharacterized protein with HEPN domain
MDRPTPKKRLEHVLESIELIGEFVSGVDEKSFL